MSSQPVTNSNPSSLHLETSDFLYLLNLIKGEVKTEINCHAIGTIQTFDPVTQTCQVLFNYQKVLKKRNATTPAPNQFSDVVIAYPMIVRVPVIVLGGGGAYLTFPISGIVKDSNGNVTYSGDTCMLMFCDRDIDGWLESGITTNPPFTSRLHDLSDAVALVGLNSVTKALKNYNTNVITMQDSTGNRLWISGMGCPWFGTTAPSGFLLCYGQSLSTTTYPELFAAIGYTYGGSGNNFNLPDCRGRILVGLDNMGGTDAMNLWGSGATEDAFTTNRDTLGGIVGEVMHTQTLNELVSHDHEYGSNADVAQGGSGAYPCADQNGFVTEDSGGGLPFNVVQPGIMVNWIIKI